MERLTTRHNGVAVIKDRSRIKEAMEKLARYEEQEDCVEDCKNCWKTKLATDTNVGTKWIPCEKDMPPQPKENPVFENKQLELYMVTVKNGDYPFRAFWNGQFFTDGWSKLSVTAWQPLPPVYKGE